MYCKHIERKHSKSSYHYDWTQTEEENENTSHCSYLGCLSFFLSIWVKTKQKRTVFFSFLFIASVLEDEWMPETAAVGLAVDAAVADVAVDAAVVVVVVVVGVPMNRSHCAEMNYHHHAS